MRGVMDAFNDPAVKAVVGVFSAQMAKTTVIENVVGYFAEHDPCPVMVVEPTLEIAETVSKDRFAPMIRDTASLRERFAPSGSKSSGDTLLHKKFPGGSLTLAGANSYNSLASRPIRVAIGDEAAKWLPNEKGSPIRQLSARVKAYWTSKLGFFSTPTTDDETNEFWQLWEGSDKSLYFVPCACGQFVVFTFDDAPASLPSEVDAPRAILRFTESAPIRTASGSSIRQVRDAWFECLSCGRRIDDVERKRMVRAGEWRATAPFTGTAGFWGWQAMAPFQSAEAVSIANEWLSALGSESTMQSAKNETLGLPWRGSGQSVDWKRLYDRRDLSYQFGTIPNGVLILTAGADVQQDRIEIQIVGWGRRQQCWLVDYIVLYGDTSRTEIWAELTKILGIVYRNENGIDFTIRKFAIDSGFATTQVYEWARRNRFGIVSVVKGGPDSQNAIVGSETAAEITIRGKRMNAGVKVHSLNVSRLKEDLQGRLLLDLPNQNEEHPDRFFHFCELPDTEEFCRQLTAEHRVSRKVKGFVRWEWEKKRPRNEALDTWNYAAAARIMLGVDRFGERQWSEIEGHVMPVVAVQDDSPAAAMAPVQPRPRMQFRMNGFRS